MFPIKKKRLYLFKKRNWIGNITAVSIMNLYIRVSFNLITSSLSLELIIEGLRFHLKFVQEKLRVMKPYLY